MSPANVWCHQEADPDPDRNWIRVSSTETLLLVSQTTEDQTVLSVTWTQSSVWTGSVLHECAQPLSTLCVLDSCLCEDQVQMQTSRLESEGKTLLHHLSLFPLFCLVSSPPSPSSSLSLWSQFVCPGCWLRGRARWSSLWTQSDLWAQVSYRCLSLCID